MATRPLINSIVVKDLRPGVYILVDDPRATARVKETKVRPESLVERFAGGGDPQPGILVRFLMMDGPKRGEVDESLLHPEDRVRTPL